MTLTPSRVAEYLRRYVEAYRSEYSRFTSPAPQGGGYPPLRISPYLDAELLECFVSPDGAAILQLGNEPEYQWWIAGGPALMADYPETRTPPEVTEFLKREGIVGKPLGIYRVVAQGGIPVEIWNGEIPAPVAEATERVGSTEIRVHRLDIGRLDFVKRLTFGVLGHILDVHLPGPESQFWRPHLLRTIGFCTADRRRRRFVGYLELLAHVDAAAWDDRSISARVRNDVRRDFALSTQPAGKGGLMSLGSQQDLIHPFIDRLDALGHVIKDFAELLATQTGAAESVFHDFLERNSILLDVYGEAVSKPRFTYPDGESPLGKLYVEPDFVIKLPGRAYKLVELERPAKRLATVQGQPRAEVTQAVFQIAEWRAYIVKHYDRIRDQFPGIALSHDAMVVISTTADTALGTNTDRERYKELLRAQYPGIEILTYTDLLDRAQQAFLRLSALAVGA